MSTQRLVLAAALLLAYALLCACTAWRWRSAQRAQRAQLNGLQNEHAPVLLAHASQTGTAEHLALQTAQQLQARGQAVRLLPLNAVTTEVLASVRQAWVIASTYGEGDAPDGASVFTDRVMGRAASANPALSQLQVGVLALGDRQYAQFCAFGLRLHQWLLAQGAQAAFEPITVHQGEPAALQAWQHALGLDAPAMDIAAGPFSPWELVARTHVNPGSQGQPMHLLTLRPQHGSATWQAGDLLHILPHAPSHAAPTPAARPPDQPREYSMASVPDAAQAGEVQLLVRAANWRDADGHPHAGLSSGQLASAPMGSVWQARIQSHRGFQIADNRQRPLILIGNGSGLAGLLAHVRARAQQAPQMPQGTAAEVWLVYGERQRAHDAHFDPLFQQWLLGGQLGKLSLCFSRDGQGPRYVQDALYHEAETLRDWVKRGAAIYVCGSVQGMASGVDAALRDVLGEINVMDLVAEGRLRRDVY